MKNICQDLSQGHPKRTKKKDFLSIHIYGGE